MPAAKKKKNVITIFSIEGKACFFFFLLSFSSWSNAQQHEDASPAFHTHKKKR